MLTAEEFRYEIGSTRTSHKRFLAALLIVALFAFYSLSGTSPVTSSAVLSADQTRKAEAIAAKSQRDAGDVKLVNCSYDSFGDPYATLRVVNRNGKESASYYIVVLFNNKDGKLIGSAYGVIDVLDPGGETSINALIGEPVQYGSCILGRVSKI